MASSHFALLLSSETPRMARPLGWYILYAFTTLGFSARQGPHQLAQKSTSTYFPLKEARETGLPFISFCTKAGAVCPVSVRSALSYASLILFPKKETCIAGERFLYSGPISPASGAKP